MTCDCGSDRKASARFGHPHLPWCPVSHDGGVADTERRHAADCRAQEAERQRDAEALQAGFELGRAAPQEEP